MNLKIPDNSVNDIITKILKKRSHKSEQITDRYYEQEIKQDSRITNYQLHDKNTELRKELKKLQKLFNNKIRFQQTINSTDMEINEARQKLKNVLNMSQTLQLSLVKVRQNQSIKVDKSRSETHCCCRRYKQTKLEYSYKKNNHKSKNKQVQTNDLQIPCIKKQKYQDSVTVQKQVQCTLTNQLETSSLQTKRKHIEKLKKLIQAQNRMLESYENKISSQSQAGKITKVSDMKINAYIKTCPSAGSIIKINRQ